MRDTNFDCTIIPGVHPFAGAPFGTSSVFWKCTMPCVLLTHRGLNVQSTRWIEHSNPYVSIGSTTFQVRTPMVGVIVSCDLVSNQASQPATTLTRSKCGRLSNDVHERVASTGAAQQCQRALRRKPCQANLCSSRCRFHGATARRSASFIKV